MAEHAEEAPRCTTTVFIITGSAETELQESIAALLVATAAATTSIVIVRSQHDGH